MDDVLFKDYDFWAYTITQGRIKASASRKAGFLGLLR
jgi:hypothetical protein